MVRVCAFPGCEKKMKSNIPETFHRLPCRYSRDILNQWLIVLQVDINTPIETLKKMDYRVCSDHFDQDDFYMAATQGKPKRAHLRKNAIPRAVQVAAERVEASGSETAINLEDAELAGVPQSTPKKSDHTQRSQSSGLHSALALSLTSPAQATVRPRTKPSLSGTYLAWPPTWRLSEQGSSTTSVLHSTVHSAASGLLTQDDLEQSTAHSSVHEMSLSFEEMELHDQADESFVALSETSTSSSSGSGSASNNGAAKAKGWAGQKWVVDESNLMELFKTCHQCGIAIEEKRVITQAGQIRIRWTCLNAHSGHWQSCPDQREMGRTNLLMCAAMLFTGATYTDIKDWAGLVNIAIPSEAQYYRIQTVYLVPVIQHTYKSQQDNIMERLTHLCASGKRAELCGDARCDSPGFSSKYSTYSFQDDFSKEIVHFELVQVSETTSSVAMEAEGFKRDLDHLLSSGLDIGVITTDRAPSIRKIMRENYGQIRHEYDPWHVNKGVMKKLLAVASKKQNEDLRPWLKSISNHLYWSCSSSHGDGEECVRRWKSLLHHIYGVHRWEESGVQHTCFHDPMTEQDQRRKRWIREDSPAFQALQDVILNQALLRDLKQMALFKHTGSLEVFHSSLLKYAPKRIHFHYDSMRARTQLAVMDHNANVSRQQATTPEGDPRHSCAYSKASHRWVARPIYVKTSQAFRQGLVETVLKIRDEDSIQPRPRPPPRDKRLLQNIAPVPRPDKSELVAKSMSRFK